ncbi:tetratricopeptide repeat protein [Daejeonella lutea]|uniref:Tetratricopeptide repeat-containing protein n=1 Tax=Daejeonella lutea TaxID=572036 RepID=A0A1T4ZWL3_9SPHI|nr:hypothetical protein [Daejeonella lutea]SKB26997.1 hypothetical protein SAMN05661099_0004 [Daejeonella lutea]
MKKQLPIYCIPWRLILLLPFFSCMQETQKPKGDPSNTLNLKSGNVAWCGPPQKEFGSVEFPTSCTEAVKKDFNMGLALLHSFEYDEAEKVFAKVIKTDPDCAMAYWGVAMSNYHPLWAPPSTSELTKGAKAIAIARKIAKKIAREAEYIDALGVFYTGWETNDHKSRCLAFEKAMEKIHLSHLEDKEAAIFYALSLDASADPTDKTFKNQKKAFRILSSLYPGQPGHPGIVHYIIHSYDYPELAADALPSARKYASIAPSSAHAQHMPSHIFTRLGLWDENIRSNLAAVSSAKCYAENAGMKGHWDEELHGMDYLMYSYLQQGDNKLAKGQWDYLNTIKEVSPVNFKVAYAYAAIPSRYLLENKNWKDAAKMKLLPATFPWEKYPWQKSIVHFTRVLGAANSGDLTTARSEFKMLGTSYDTLMKRGQSYEASQVMIQLASAEAWILFKEDKNTAALELMKRAANMEDATEKHPVTPGEVVPARELLGEMLLQMNKTDEALTAFEANLKKHPNRFNGLYGAAISSQKSNPAKSNMYFRKLTQIANSPNSGRPELVTALSALKN